MGVRTALVTLVVLGVAGIIALCAITNEPGVLTVGIVNILLVIGVNLRMVYCMGKKNTSGA